MESNPKKASDDIKNLAARFKGFIEVGELLEKLGNIDQETRDASARKDAAVKDEASAKESKVRAESDLAIEISKIEKVKSDAASIKDSADAYAKATVDRAQKDAQSIRFEVSNIKADYIKSISGKNDEIVSLQSEIEHKKQELSQITKQIEDVKKKISGII